MRAKADIIQGLILARAITLALSAKISPQEAQRLVEEASQKTVSEKRGLQNVLIGDPRADRHVFDHAPAQWAGVVAIGAARMLGGAGGKRLTCYTTACHWDQVRLHGPCVSGTRLHFDRPSGSDRAGRDDRSDRSRLTRTQA
jgi:hypothetical protein